MKTQSAEPTVLPWSTQGAGKVFDQYGNLIADCPWYGAGIIPADYVAPWHSSDANAALIVRAVNHHARLVAALERLMSADEPYFLDAERSEINCQSDGKSARMAELGKARNEARAALASVTG